MKGSKLQVNQALTPIAFEILLSLSRVPRHGYGIKLDIEERTAGEVSLGSGTLYQAIQRLERSGLISEATADQQGHDARRGRSYQLEPAGRTALEGELRRLNRVVEYARSNSLLPDPEAP
jgi:DNA-binding PadR family transcriptional regulator